MTKISLLYKIPEPETRTPENTVYNLSLDRTMDISCSDVKAQRYFLKIASSPLTIKENIIYRRQILTDLMNNKDMYYDLYDILGKFYDIGRYNERERKYRFSAKANDEEVSFANTRQALEMTAITVKKTLEILKELYEFLDAKNIVSDGFVSLKDRVAEIVNCNAYSELWQICTYFTQIPDIESVESCMSIDRDGNIYVSRLVSCNEEREIQKTSGGFFGLGKKKDKNADEGKFLKQKLVGISLPFGNSVMYAAFSEPAKILDYIVASVFEEFGDIREEMLFYKAGLKFLMFLDEKRVPYVFPELVEEPIFQCEDLYDTYLSALYTSMEGVVPNDAFIGGDNDGILVFGKNNTGKTVYLRSIGTAQLFAQAGFPVTAKKAKIGIRSGIFTQFAASEKEFEEGNEAGRFEQEVREIASLVDRSDENALILFNETFQTTAYSEGAEGLYHVLRYLSSRKTHWVLVTHLSGLFGRFDSNVRCLKTTDNFHLE
ncbi:MAG: hypothetical protein E7675_07805 [Ruminococcaceae bacterium]|nr:hypothetical protein [Oscillospiraceae bacterium]